MKTRAQKSTTCSAIAAFAPVIPVLGWAVSAVLLFISLVLAIASMCANEKGGVRAMINSVLAAPVAVAVAVAAVYIIGQ